MVPHPSEDLSFTHSRRHALDRSIRSCTAQVQTWIEQRFARRLHDFSIRFSGVCSDDDLVERAAEFRDFFRTVVATVMDPLLAILQSLLNLERQVWQCMRWLGAF